MRKAKKINKIKIKTNTFALLVLLCFIVGMSASWIFYSLYNNLGIAYVPMRARLIDFKGIGLAADADKLNFGSIPLSGTAERYITLTNEKDFKIRVQLAITGNISKIVYANITDFVLKPNETQQISFVAFHPRNATIGEYNGTLVIKYTRN